MRAHEECVISARARILLAHSTTCALVGVPPQLAGQLEIRATLLPRVASNDSAHIAALRKTKETAMFSLTQISRTTQQFVCMTLSAIIVTASLSLGAYGAQSATHPDYVVTITQLQ